MNIAIDVLKHRKEELEKLIELKKVDLKSKSFFWKFRNLISYNKEIISIQKKLIEINRLIDLESEIALFNLDNMNEVLNSLKLQNLLSDAFGSPIDYIDMELNDLTNIYLERTSHINKQTPEWLVSIKGQKYTNQTIDLFEEIQKLELKKKEIEED